MDLENVQRAAFSIGAPAHPALVVERIGQVPQDRRAVGPQLHAEAVGVTVVHKAAVPPVDPVLVHHARLGVLHEALPEVAVVDFLHGDLLPLTELPNERDAGGAGREGPEHKAVSGPVCA